MLDQPITARFRTRAVITAAVVLPAAGLAAPAIAAGVPTPAGGELQRPMPTPSETKTVRLSNESTLTRWAHAEKRAPVRRRPGPSPAITRLRFRTEDGFPEVYLVLRRHIDADGRAWIQVRLPMRPNGRTGWVRSPSLGPLYSVRTQLVIDTKGLRASLYRSGRRIWRSPVGVGARSTPTPRGRFWIRERIRVADPGGLYGPWAFGTSAYSRLSDWPGGGVVGIHGTNEPSLIPGRPSHGCIRVPNPAVRRLARLLPVGTPVHIR